MNMLMLQVPNHSDHVDLSYDTSHENILSADSFHYRLILFEYHETMKHVH